MLSSCCLNTVRSILGKEGTSDLLALFYLKRGNQYCVVIKINVQKYFIRGCFYEHKSNTIMYWVNNTWITWLLNKSSFFWAETKYLVVRNYEKPMRNAFIVYLVVYCSQISFHNTMPMRHSLFWKIGFRFVVPDNKEWYKVKFHPNYMYMHCVYKKRIKAVTKVYPYSAGIVSLHVVNTFCRNFYYPPLM